MQSIENLKEKLREKINKEYYNFVTELKKLEAKEIIDRAYEYVCKQEMIYIYENKEFSEQEYKALLKCTDVLSDCYDEWLKTDANFNELLEYAVDNSTEHILDDFKQKIKQKNMNIK